MTETAGTDTTSTAGTLSGARRGADTVFAYLAALMVLGVIVQFFLAGLGVFGLDGKSVQHASSLDPHRALGNILGAVALLMLIAALVARTSKAAIWGSVALVILVGAVQVALAGGGKHHDWLGGLHALDGVIILGLAGWMHALSRGNLRHH